MRDTNFYLKLGGALLLSLAGASILSTGIEYRGLIAAISAVTGILVIRSARKSSLMEGRTDRMKVSLTSSTLLFELLLFVGATTVAVVPKYAAVIVLASIAFTEMLYLETSQQLKTAFNPDLGRDVRVTLLAFSLASFSFNTFFLFYGILFIAVTAIYDSLRLIHRLRRHV